MGEGKMHVQKSSGAGQLSENPLEGCAVFGGLTPWAGGRERVQG